MTAAAQAPKTARVGPTPRFAGGVPIDLILEPLLVVVGFVGYLIWHAAQTFTKTEAQLEWSALGESVWQHIQLTVVSAVLVVLIAIPLGILVTRKRFARVAPVIVALANVGQAAPVLGMVVLFAMWFGTGFRTAVAALVVYAVLPILQNTVTGLRQVDDRVIEAARGQGFSAFQTLLRVELPLSVPVILHGVRTALVILVGTATLGTFIGAGGLGVLITTGVTLYLPALLFSGALLVALLALAIDWLARLAEYLLAPRGLRGVTA
ncbi:MULTISPECIES: ABC transporter permease [Tsukamurella]|uniref:ABC transporter permease n=2 Tax=Tsukamurella TaxID=2060 RepID=A0A5C5RX15_9ACTN|nr:ABC transporter permease [Tsukamurella columbiensis]TWS27596.1 ABC transporter permease [Tsukamurella conjunctivitidis]